MEALSLPTVGPELSVFLSMKILCGARGFLGKPEACFMCESFFGVANLPW